MAMPDHIIAVEAEPLSDGSTVYNVILGNVKIPAITENDADQMSEKIMDAINDHSNDIADVI